MKPKIPKLTKKERRMWIKALKDVLYNYENEIPEWNCPLCNISKKINCSDCVWWWFIGMTCSDYLDFKGKQWQKYPLYFSAPRWVKLRIRQIPRWIKKLEEGL